jgi:hypothetical protein
MYCRFKLTFLERHAKMITAVRCRIDFCIEWRWSFCYCLVVAFLSRIYVIHGNSRASVSTVVAPGGLYLHCSVLCDCNRGQWTHTHIFILLKWYQTIKKLVMWHSPGKWYTYSGSFLNNRNIYTSRYYEYTRLILHQPYTYKAVLYNTIYVLPQWEGSVIRRHWCKCTTVKRS